jgi:hypothetical protein
MTAKRGTDSGNAGQGHHWIRDAKRRKIYERDGWCCRWCRGIVGIRVASTGDMRPLPAASLDHFLPRSKGGSNLSTNVFTSCQTCNSKRRDLSALEFARKLTALQLSVLDFADYRIRTAWQFDILTRVLDAIDHPVESPRALARVVAGRAVGIPLDIRSERPKLKTCPKGKGSGGNPKPKRQSHNG